MAEQACLKLEAVRAHLPAEVSALEQVVVDAVPDVLFHVAKALNMQRTHIGEFPVESLLQIAADLSALPPKQHESLKAMAEIRALLEDGVNLESVSKSMQEKVSNVPAAERLQWPEQNQKDSVLLFARIKNCRKLLEKIEDPRFDISAVVQGAEKVAESVTCLTRQAGNMILDSILKSLKSLDRPGKAGTSWRAELPREASFKQTAALAQRLGMFEGDDAEHLHKQVSKAQEDCQKATLS